MNSETDLKYVNISAMITLVFALVFSAGAMASQPTGKLSGIAFVGFGDGEVISVTIEPKVSDCPYAGKFVMPTKSRPAIISALIEAFQAQNAVAIHGMGSCHSVWANYEEL